jgi:two-component system, cell cycle response regulator
METNEKISILLVDDRQENLLALEKLLRSPELAIVTATSGNEALSLVLDHDFALILLDVQMPEMDGFETAELIRGNSDSRHIPIIFVTAISTEQKHVFKGYASGAVDYLFKPVDPDILFSKVNIFLALHRQKIALKKMNEALQRANQKILEQQKHVIEEERLKVLLQMAGATAHELSQPLMLLLGSIEMLELEANRPERMAYHINNIKRAGTRISETIRKIHTVRRAETKLHDPGAQIINLDQKIRILSIEDSDEDFKTIGALLKDERAIELFRASTIKEAFDTFKKTDISLIFLDHCLPDGTGFDFLIGAEQKSIDIPVVIITGQGDEMLASQMIQAGAYDYLPKIKLGKAAIARVIQNALEKAQLKKEVRMAQEKMAQLSTKDELTGLYNRRYFDEVLKQEILRSARYDVDFSLCILDLDHFKRVNDTLGHMAGDKVLREIAALITSGFRQNDIKCRYGGEEFAVIFPHTNLKDAVTACETFRESLAATHFEYDAARFQMTMSIGVTSFSLTGATTNEAFIQQADQALYQAKAAGRDRILVHGTS